MEFKINRAGEVRADRRLVGRVRQDGGAWQAETLSGEVVARGQSTRRLAASALADRATEARRAAERCPRCGSEDTRPATNFGRLQEGRLHCLRCGALWSAGAQA